MTLTVYLLNAFAKTPLGGNPAGVVAEGSALSEQQMQKAAGIVGVSETAFLLPSSAASRRVRFFTPVAEVPLCGHATIASFSFLFQKALIKSGVHSQETKSGILGIEIAPDGIVFMKQCEPIFSEIVPREEILHALNLSTEDLCRDLPAQVVSTGLRDVIVPVNSLRALTCLRPDFEVVAALCRKYRAVSLHPFTLETKNNSTAHCRDFAPLYGVNEESATGTASGALACYLRHHAAVNCAEMVFEQGYSMDRPSEILARFDSAGSVWVGGIAVSSGKMEVEL
ncbi:MAG TPA: PhzF family phenazine biosynthesis protein [Elusimicrobiales bacterium]|nr:PhzF family phenazine biosynthesis protein [Elusimicrobiales bacterium]